MCEHRDIRAQHERCLPVRARDQRGAALQRVLIHTGERDRGPHPGLDGPDRRAVCLQAADARRGAEWHDANGFVDGERPRPDGARHHGPRASDRERAVDGQSKDVVRRARLHRLRGCRERAAQCVQTRLRHD